MTFLYILLVLLGLFILVICESTRENLTVRKTEYDIDTGKNRNLRFAFIADYHQTMDGRTNGKIKSIIEKEKPDFIISAGDMIVGSSIPEKKQVAIDLLNELSSIARVFISNGNHEQRYAYNDPNGYADFRKKLSDSVTWLDNETSDFSEDIRIYGLDIDYKYYKRFEKVEMKSDYLLELFHKKPENDKLNIMIAHDPEYIDAYADFGPDIILSGHLHGGIVRLPLLGGVISPRLKFFPKYDYGFYKVKNSSMIVTNGLGSHSIPLRLFNTPEVVIINVR